MRMFRGIKSALVGGLCAVGAFAEPSAAAKPSVIAGCELPDRPRLPDRVQNARHAERGMAAVDRTLSEAGEYLRCADAFFLTDAAVEELAPHMRHARHLGDAGPLAVEPVVAGIAIGMQDAAEGSQMLGWSLALPVRAVAVEGVTGPHQVVRRQC